jgi:hypothetical protein
MNQLRSRFLIRLCLCSATLTFVAGVIAGPNLPPAEVSSILESGHFQDLHSTKDVPVDVLQKCFPNETPADPGKPWNSSDDVRDATLPFSRVTWLATDGTHWLFAWEHGGRAYSNGYMLVSKTGGVLPTVIWDAGWAEKPLNTFQEFQEYVRRNGQFAVPSFFRP